MIGFFFRAIQVSGVDDGCGAQTSTPPPSTTITWPVL
jgi:hypothetical protein